MKENLNVEDNIICIRVITNSSSPVASHAPANNFKSFINTPAEKKKILFSPSQLLINMFDLTLVLNKLLWHILQLLPLLEQDNKREGKPGFRCLQNVSVKYSCYHFAQIQVKNLLRCVLFFLSIYQFLTIVSK